MEHGRVEYGGTTIIFHDGDIAQVKADALITAVNATGEWFDGIDRVIIDCAGILFHKQLRQKMPLRDCTSYIARSGCGHRGEWNDVVFVVDELQVPLSDIIDIGLVTAEVNGYRSVSLPAIRTGVMLGQVEPDAETAVRELIRGVMKFVDEHPETSVKEINFVVFRNPELLRLLLASEAQLHSHSLFDESFV